MTEENNTKAPRGFAAMPEYRRKHHARLGGLSVRRRRGFAAMDPERVREIASKGGKSVDPAKRYFATNPEAAKLARAVQNVDAPGEGGENE